MTPEEMRRHGTALAERVRHEVDTEARLRLMLGERRRMRRLQVAMAAAAIIAVLVGVFALSRAVSEPPVITEPTPPTIEGLSPLPVEVFLVLANDYSVDAATGSCSGSGEVSEVAEGASISVVDPSGGEEVVSITLPLGVEIMGDTTPSYLVAAGVDTGCLFTLGELDLPASDFDLLLPGDPNTSMGNTRSGQRQVIVVGG